MATIPELKFLVVDDMSTMRKIVSAQLKANGATRLAEADDGATAWEQLEKCADNPAEVFQFIVSDWNMPKLPGIELLRKCRAHPVYKNIAFLMVTGEAEINQVKEALVAGVDNYVVKPFTPDAFKEKLLAVYNKRFGKK